MLAVTADQFRRAMSRLFAALTFLVLASVPACPQLLRPGIVIAGSPACSNKLDFSQACNSQYLGH